METYKRIINNELKNEASTILDKMQMVRMQMIKKAGNELFINRSELHGQYAKLLQYKEPVFIDGILSSKFNRVLTEVKLLSAFGATTKIKF